jgi:drug/metabolite transporter (DMT)-like permease
VVRRLDRPRGIGGVGDIHGVAIGSVLSSTAPLFALPLGLVFLGERTSAWAVVGALVAVAGVVVLQL